MDYLNINTLDSQEIARHHLHGLRYGSQREAQFQDPWKRQLLNNQIVKYELEKLGGHFEVQGVQPVLLKGFALLGDIYTDWGARFTSDVDILVTSEEWPRFKKILQQNAYELVEDKKWLGNSFKFQFLKKSELIEFNIEVHLRLFWHCEMEDLTIRPSPAIPNYFVLGHEELLVHLCGHLAFQHSFLKLFWLIDIDTYVKRYEKEINWLRFWKMAKKNKLLISCALCIGLIDEDLAKEITAKEMMTIGQRVQFKMLKSIVSSAFLLNPQEHLFKYLLVKNLTKDHFKANFSYWKNWLFK